MVNKTDVVLKTLLIGEGAVGKTSLIERWIHGRFKHDYSMTIGTNISSKLIELEKLNIKLVIHDIAGQKRFSDLRSAYFMETRLCMIVYDCTRPYTLEALIEEWIPGLIEANPVGNLEKVPRIIGILVANKVDLEQKREISRQKGFGAKRRLKNQFGERISFINYLETSAKENVNVNEAFTAMVEGFLEEIQLTDE